MAMEWQRITTFSEKRCEPHDIWGGTFPGLLGAEAAQSYQFVLLAVALAEYDSLQIMQVRCVKALVKGVHERLRHVSPLRAGVQVVPQQQELGQVTGHVVARGVERGESFVSTAWNVVRAGPQHGGADIVGREVERLAVGAGAKVEYVRWV